MTVEITKEQIIENKIYFEVMPVDFEYKEKFIFGKEVENNFNNDSEIETARIQILDEAKTEFLKQIEKNNI